MSSELRSQLLKVRLTRIGTIDVSANFAIVSLIAVERLLAVLVSCFSKSVSQVVTIDKTLLIFGITIPISYDIRKLRYLIYSGVIP
jgi:hypothetical protein